VRDESVLLQRASLVLSSYFLYAHGFIRLPVERDLPNVGIHGNFAGRTPPFRHVYPLRSPLLIP
jgi:hypothetical protein